MIVVRSVLHGKFGSGGPLASLVADAMRRIEEGGLAPDQGGWRVLSDLSGPFDTVIIESRVESIAAWEQLRNDLFANPGFMEAMAESYEMVVSGHQEYYNIEAEG